MKARRPFGTSGTRDQTSNSMAPKATSRRRFLAGSAALAAGGTGAAIPIAPAHAQGDVAADRELTRLQVESRILLKGGVVLTLDRQIGDFIRADVLIDSGKIAEVRPNIPVSEDTMVVDAERRIIIPGFVDTQSHSYQGLLRNIQMARSIPTTTGTSRRL